MKTLLLTALVFLGLNTFAQQPNLPDSQKINNSRVMIPGRPMNQELLRNRNNLRRRFIISRRLRNNIHFQCKKCAMIHKKHHTKNRKHSHHKITRF